MVPQRGPGERAVEISLRVPTDLTVVEEAVDLVAGYKGWSKMEAYRFVSVACDVHVTQLVDGSVGVHVMIPKAVLR